jgi:hypothetical protein
MWEAAIVAGREIDIQSIAGASTVIGRVDG